MTTNPPIPILPADPVMDQYGRVLGNKPIDFWLPVLEYLRNRFNLPPGRFYKFENGKNPVFSLAQEFVVKLVPPCWSEDAGHEIAALREVNKFESPYKFPKLIGFGLLDGWTVIISGKLPGFELSKSWQSMENYDRLRFARQIGQIAGYLHALLVEDPTGLTFDWQRLLKIQCNDLPEILTRECCPSSLVNALPEFLERANIYTDPVEAAVFLHGDLSGGNIMIFSKDNKTGLDGLIDFGDSSYGPAVHDFLSPNVHNFRGEPRMLAAFFDGYGLPTDKRTVELQYHLNARTVMWYGWQYLVGKFSLYGLNSWEQVVQKMWPLVN